MVHFWRRAVQQRCTPHHEVLGPPALISGTIFARFCEKLPAIVKYTLILISALISSMFLYSCTSCTRTKDVVCADGALELRGVGYTADDIYSATIAKYTANNNFDSLIERTPISYISYGHDTTVLTQVIPGYDYILSLPPLTYRITNITLLGQTHKVYSYTMVRTFQCFNNVGHCNINNTPNTAIPDKFADFPNSYIYFRK